MRYGIIVAVVLLAGCESMPRGEWAYQSAHLIDVLQTYNGPASDRCYRELNPVTRKIIGDHPSKEGVVLWGIGMSVGHYLISRQLEKHAPEWALSAWQMVTFSGSAYTVYDNHQTGIRPWGDNKHSADGLYAHPDCDAYIP